MKKATTLTILIFLLISCSENKIDKDKRNIQIQCDQIMLSFKNKQYKEGTDRMKQITDMDSVGLDTLAMEMSEQISSSELFKTAHSHEYIYEKNVGNFLTKRYYAIKYEKTFLIFTFTLYKNNYYWRLINFTYDDEYSELLK